MNAPLLQAGTIVGDRYQIHGTLAVSASASTYTATASDGHGVVIKMFPPALAQRGDLMGMLQQYNGAINALPEAAAVRVLDAGYDGPTGAPFVASEYVAWPSLATMVSQGHATLDRATALLTALARSLEPAHAMQMPHQSLRPTNVFVAPVGGAVRLTDFGTMVPRGAMFGPDELGPALAFLAPEQLPPGTPAGAAADTFTAILVMFYAMTGVSFWRSCQTASVDPNAWRTEVASPPRASDRAREVGVAFPSSLDPVFARALAYQPSDRYPSIGALAQAFAAAVQDAASMPAVPVATAPAQPRLGKKGTMMLGAEGSAEVIAAAQAAQAAAQQQQQANAASALPPFPPPGAPTPAIPPPPSPGASAPFSPAPLPAVPMMDDAGLPSTKKKSSRLVVALVAIPVLGVLLGGAWFAFSGSGDKPANSSHAATSSSPPDPSTSSSSPAVAVTSAAPVEVASATPSATPAADTPNVTLSCDPACDDIKVDGKSITSPLTLAPGIHRVSVAKGGFLPQNDSIKIVAGVPFSKEYKLKEPSAPSGPSSPNPKKPCGTFVNPCKK